MKKTLSEASLATQVGSCTPASHHGATGKLHKNNCSRAYDVCLRRWVRRAFLAVGCAVITAAALWSSRPLAQTKGGNSPADAVGVATLDAHMRLLPADLGFPTEETTGFPKGIALVPSGDVVVTRSGTVLSGLDIRGQVLIRAENVTLQNCRITYPGGYAAVRITPGLKGTVVQNCEINGSGKSLQGIAGGGTFRRNNIYGVENGINVEDEVPTYIEGNYIHGFKAEPDPHYDGIQIFGSNSNVTVERNTIAIEHASTGAVYVSNTFGPISNVRIHNNYLSGGSMPIYFDGSKSEHPMTGVSFTNNYVRRGYWGYEYIKPDSQGNLPAMNGNIEISSKGVQSQ